MPTSPRRSPVKRGIRLFLGTVLGVTVLFLLSDTSPLRRVAPLRFTALSNARLSIPGRNDMLSVLHELRRDEVIRTRRKATGI
jgi:hypothetical protein